MLISIETYRTCDFPEGGRGGPDMWFRHAYDRSTCFFSEANPKDRFSHAMVHFPLLELLLTLQNMMRYIILDILSGTGTLNGISMH